MINSLRRVTSPLTGAFSSSSFTRGITNSVTSKIIDSCSCKPPIDVIDNLSVKSCKEARAKISNNIPLFKEAMETGRGAKVAVIDSSVFSQLEDSFNIKHGMLGHDDVCILLRNMGFDYYLDYSLITDYEIINDAKRIFRHGNKGFSTTIGSFSHLMTKKLLNIDPTGAESIPEVFLGSNAQFTTYVITDSIARCANSILFFSNPHIFTSVGLTITEFIKVAKEKEAAFNGSPCQRFPLGSAEGVRAVTNERFASAAINSFEFSFNGSRIPALDFKEENALYSVAKFEIMGQYPASIATVKGMMGFSLLSKGGPNNVMYISPSDCITHLSNEEISAIDAEAVKRKIKYAIDNKDAYRIWKYFMKMEDDEAYINKKTGYY